MELIRSIIAELPTIEGNFIQNISNPGKRRHVIFLPMQKKTIVQYITKYILELIRVNHYYSITHIPSIKIVNFLVAEIII